MDLKFPPKPIVSSAAKDLISQVNLSKNTISTTPISSLELGFRFV